MSTDFIESMYKIKKVEESTQKQMKKSKWEKVYCKECKEEMKIVDYEIWSSDYDTLFDKLVNGILCYECKKCNYTDSRYFVSETIFFDIFENESDMTRLMREREEKNDE